MVDRRSTAADEPVLHLLRRAAAGDPPPPDGSITVVPMPPGPAAGVLAFTAHSVVAADVEPEWVAARLPVGDLSAPLGPSFLNELGTHLGRTCGSLDAVLVAHGTAGEPPIELVPVTGNDRHPRVERAERYRTDVQAHRTADGTGVLVLGRGLAGRWELGFEVAPEARDRGLGRALAAAAPHLVPVGEPIFAQVAPGNVASLRAVIGAGCYSFLGAEMLFVR